MTRIYLLVTSPRLPAGLLTVAAWDLLRTHPVLTAVDGALADAVRAAGADLTVVPAEPERVLERAGTVVWLAGPDGDPELARALGLRLAQEPGLAELELVYGSWDPVGARLLDAVAVIDRLVSPGGDPWKRAQTHASLAQYLLEEAYEAYDAIDAGDLAALREELGDVLLQVLLHARLAEELPGDERWTIDDLAADFVAKMIRRNPHVFAGVDVADMDDILENWERIKREEKARDSVFDGIPSALPALALATKVLARAERVGLSVPVPASDVDAGSVGETLLGLVAAARAAGVDPEAALRRAALTLAETLRATEPRVDQGEEHTS